MDKEITGKVLKCVLIASAFGWGISAAGIFASWDFVVDQLNGLGGDVPNDPMLNYWFRMTAVAFTFIGCHFLYLSIKPETKIVQLKIAAFFKLVLGVVLLFYWAKLKLFIIPCGVDALFCLAAGGSILLCAFKIEKGAKAES